jgi:hypothetical protein
MCKIKNFEYWKQIGTFMINFKYLYIYGQYKLNKYGNMPYRYITILLFRKLYFEFRIYPKQK